MFNFLNHKLFYITKYIAWLGMLFLLAAMFITTMDIILRKINGEGIYGTIDLVQLMILSAAYLSIPHAFMCRSHVAVSVFADMLPARILSICHLLASILACIFMMAIAFYGFEQANMQHQYGDISITLGIPLIFYWVPLLFGAAVSVLVTINIAIGNIYTIITGKGALSLEEE